MYGRAMKCDVCNKTELLDLHKDVYFVDDAPLGWIRLFINRPTRYGWSGDTVTSEMQAGFDCCSISCAHNILYRAAEAIPEVTTEASA